MSTQDFKCQVILHQAPGVPIVFLHGMSYTSGIWQRIGVTTLLTAKKIPFLALDMPYGMKSECQPKSRSPEKNIALAKAAIEEAFGEKAPVIVGASIGAHTALQFAVRHSVKGLLLSGAVRVLDPELLEAYPRFKFPVRLLWGTEDNIASGEDLRMIAEKMLNAKLVTYEGGGHSVYVNQPDRFKLDLLELYAQAESSP